MAALNERDEKLFELVSALGELRASKKRFTRTPDVNTAIGLQATQRRHKKAVESVLEVVGGKDHDEER